MMNKQLFTSATILCVLLVVGCDDGPNMPDYKVADAARSEEIRAELENASQAEGGGDSAVEAAGPAGYGTLKGRFTFDGEVPALPQLTITQNADVCAPGGATVYDQNIAVDAASKGLANVLIYLDKVPDSLVHESAKTPAEAEVLFDQKNCVFLTRVVAMNTAQTLKVLNSDPIGHNFKLKSFNQTVVSGGSLPYQPKKADAVPQKIACSVHPWMSAWFIGRENSYFAVTAKDGSFEIPNVPAGTKLTVKVWHELSGPVSGEVSENGQSTKWKKGKLAMTIDPDATKELNVVLTPSVFK